MAITARVMAAAAAAALLAAGGASAAERSFPVSGFDRVNASGSEDVTIITGKSASVVATGDKDRLDRLDIRVEGGVLKIGHKRQGWGDWNWRDGDKTRITVTMPSLKGLRLSGSGDVTADKGSGPSFSVDLSGSGDVRVAAIDSPDVMLSTAGSGDITAAGRCSNLRVSISGSGDMMLDDLSCANADVRVAGSGNVGAHASTTAKVSVAGSGDVRITGRARCQISKSGSGEITCGG